MGFALYSHLFGVRCSRSVPLRLDNSDDDAVLELTIDSQYAERWEAREGWWTLGLKQEAGVLLDLGSNGDSFSRLFGRRGQPGPLRDQLQTELADVLLHSAWLHEKGRILPSHDYQVAAFPVRPVRMDAAEAFRDTGLVGAGRHQIPQQVPEDGLGWNVVYRHALPARGAGCPTHLLLAPLHDAHDATAVRRYESLIRDGHRPVALALCAGLPYNAAYHSGMDIGAILGYFWHDRENADMRAVLERAEAAADAGNRRAEATAVELRGRIEEREANPYMTAQEQMEERRRALDCQTIIEDSYEISGDSYVRLGLCLILDGHHKIRAAANLGAALTVLCYGLQGRATTHNEPHWPPLFFDSEAIFEAIGARNDSRAAGDN